MRLMRTRYILSLSFAVYQNPKNILEQKQFGEAKKTKSTKNAKFVKDEKKENGLHGRKRKR